jgi:hypothetical protein
MVQLTTRWLALVLVLASTRAMAAGWTHDPGHFYLQLGTAFSYANQQYNELGTTIPITVPKLSTDPTMTNVSNYQQLLTDLYFEVGALKRLTIIGDLGVVSNRALNPGGDINYSGTTMSDMWLGARVGLLTGEPIAAALELRLGFPSGDPKRPLPTGSGDFHGELRAVVSKSFERVPLWFDVEMGFVLRGGAYVYNALSSAADHTALVNYAPQISLHGELGVVVLKWKQAERLLLIASVDYLGSTTRSAMSELSLALYPDNSELTTINVNLMAYLWRGLGLSLRASQAVEGLRQPILTTFGGAVFARW